MSFGHKHAGAIEKTMDLYQSKINSLYLTEDSGLDNKQIASLAIDIYNEYVLMTRRYLTLDTGIMMLIPELIN